MEPSQGPVFMTAPHLWFKCESTFCVDAFWRESPFSYYSICYFRSLHRHQIADCYGQDLFTVDKSTKIGKRSVCGPLIDFRRGAQNFYLRNTPKSEDIILSLVHLAAKTHSRNIYA